MFGISPLGWLHTLGSLPAIPAAIYMLARYGRIVPRSRPGLIYFLGMMLGGITVFLVTKSPLSSIIGAVTLVLLIAGYGVEHVAFLGRARKYLETAFLTLSVFLLMVPSVSETLRRVPDGHPIASDPNSPVLKLALGSLLVMLIIGLPTQIFYLRRGSRRA
ncbi:hypothetical protein ACLBWS_04065 [Brucellaceae bacterium D45D]